MKKLLAVVSLVAVCTPLCAEEVAPTKIRNQQPHNKSASSSKKTSSVEQPKNSKATSKKKSATAEKKVETVSVPDTAYVIDRVEAVIFGAEVTDIVTLSDIQRIGFDGQFHTKEDVVADRLMFQDAMRYRITMDEQAVDEYIAKIAKNTNSTIDDIKTMFAQAGYTYEEGRRQFAIMYANNQLIDHKIRSRLIVPEQLVVEYYSANPIIKPATYVLERAFVPATQETWDEVKKNVDRFVQTGKGLIVAWYLLPEISQNDLAENKQFIAQLKIGEVSAPQEMASGFELFRMKSKKPAHAVPLEERYRDIVEFLRRPKFEEQLGAYKKELLTAGSVLYL